jgi:hypothetical protein
MIKFWFPTLISCQVLENFKQHNSYLENKALEIQKKSKSDVKTNWACDTYNTLGAYNYAVDSDPIIQDFVQVWSLDRRQVAGIFMVSKNYWGRVAGGVTTRRNSKSDQRNGGGSSPTNFTPISPLTSSLSCTF